MENKHNIHQNSIYTCPMHPDITGKKGDRCPKCGMELQPKSPEDTGDYHVSLSTAPEEIEVGKPALLTLEIARNGETASLDISHDRKLHLIIVSEDLGWFRHVHPKEQADGSFSIEESFPKGGKYLLFVDFKPKGSETALSRLELNVKGKPARDRQGLHEKLVAEVNGYKLVLENGDDLKTNRPQALKLSVEKGGKKITESDLERYLGANAHIVMIGKADKEYLHIHPVSHPDFLIYAETFIERPGIYRVWVQFQTKGKVHTADFTVNVVEGREEHNSNRPHHHDN